MTERQEHRLQAIQIACALPSDPADALLVLRAAERIVRTFLISPAEKTAAAPAKVISLVGGD